MNRDAFLEILEECLLSIKTPRFYETERGFQGELLALLRARLPPEVIPAEAIIEQEHQKRLADHSVTTRPDIIVHEPFDPSRHRRRDEGNYVVIELKRRGGRAEALEDFQSIAGMFHALHYQLGVFVNIASAETFATDVPEELRGQVVCYAVQLDQNSRPKLIVSHT